MSRRHLLIHIDDYLSGVLTGTDRALIDDYLENNPDEKAFVERERELKELLSSISTPDPGGQYWENLERNIVKRIERPENSPAKPQRVPLTVSEISRYLVPLAAVLLLFIGSLSIAELPATPQQQIAATGSIESEIDRNIDYYEKFALDFEIVGSTVLGPPGSLGRKIVLMGIFDGIN